MSKIRPRQDIRSLSEFRANIAAFVEQVRASKRPLVLTQHGRGTAVLMDVDAYEALLDRVELQEDLRIAEAQVAAGRGIAHGKAHATLRAKLASLRTKRRRTA